MLRILISTLFTLSGCAFDPRGGEHPSEGVGEDPTAPGALFDPSLEQPDASRQELPLEAPCRPTVDQCAASLTCRLVGEDQGRCRPAGLGLPGAACGDDAACGADMTCLLDGGAKRCFALCRRQALLEYCAPQQTCDLPWGSEWITGICTPL